MFGNLASPGEYEGTDTGSLQDDSRTTSVGFRGVCTVHVPSLRPDRVQTAGSVSE